MKRITIISLLICLMLCLTGCESNNVKEAKEAVDSIYENTNELVRIQSELDTLNSKAYLSTEEENEKAMLERQEILCETCIEGATYTFKELYLEMSDKNKDIMKEYVKEACVDNVVDIWSD